MTEREQQRWNDLQQWYNSPLGSLFAATEAALLKEVLSRLFGHHVVTLGMPTGRDLLATSPIPYRYHLDVLSPPAEVAIDLLAEPTHLPFTHDCIDVVILPHILEFATEPQTVLKEVDRILIPEGRVIILGFNPLSTWGLCRSLHVNKGYGPWNARFIGVSRIRNWLSALGFEMIAVRYCFYRPPLKNALWLGRLASWERVGAKWWSVAGGGYMLVAKKRVSTLTLIKPRWHSRRHFLTEGIANRSWRKPVS